MNLMERKMVDILKKVGDCGAISVKAEFESEGTRVDELLRLLDIARKANLKITIKIGGCEAIRDLMEIRQYGVDYVVAPMIETPYALSKYIAATASVYEEDDRKLTNFLFNLETFTAYESLNELLAVAKSGKLDGVVFGRVDFAGSLGKTRESVESQDIMEKILVSAECVKKAGIDFVVGGAISVNSIANLKRISTCYLSRFETRKIVFDAKTLNSERVEENLSDAVYFELLWLENKQNYYSKIASEDAKRIELLRNRLKS